MEERPIRSTKSCSDISDLEDNSRSCSKYEKLPKSCRATCGKPQECLHLLIFLFLLSLYFVHHKHFSVPLRFQQLCTSLVGPCGKPLRSSFSFQMSPCTYILLSSPAILNYLNLLEFQSCLGLVTYLVRGKVPRARAIKEWLISIYFLIISVKLLR